MNNIFTLLSVAGVLLTLGMNGGTEARPIFNFSFGVAPAPMYYYEAPPRYYVAPVVPRYYVAPPRYVAPCHQCYPAYDYVPYGPVYHMY